MKFADYLMKPVTSLADREPEKKPLITKKRITRIDNKNRHNEAERRYRGVMGSEWKTTAQITQGICEWNTEHGFKPISSAFPTLQKWEKRGLLEMRDSGDQRKGRNAKLEWRWI